MFSSTVTLLLPLLAMANPGLQSPLKSTAATENPDLAPRAKGYLGPP